MHTSTINKFIDECTIDGLRLVINNKLAMISNLQRITNKCRSVPTQQCRREAVFSLLGMSFGLLREDRATSAAAAAAAAATSTTAC